MFQHMKRFCHSLIDVAKPVATALAENRPVVALETTILTHGMPYPINLQTALAVEELVKEQGSVPATIGVMNGRIKVGMDEQSLAVLASSDTESIKISRRDFPVAISRGLCGGTTVAGTLVVSKLVGIDVFVTGGIGGVHRDVTESMDISADLIELSRSPIMVVSSGVKSILDIGRTLEYLETLGVCVVTYDHSKDFPAFYTRKSGHQSVYNVTTPLQAAELLYNVKKLGLESGILLGVPIPEQYSLNEQSIQNAIENALKSCKENGLSGKTITPFILGEVSKITEGRSLDSNIALIKNNAVVGSKIAVALKEKKFLQSSSGSTNSHRKYSTRTVDTPKNFPSKKVVVIGGSNMDILVRPDEPLQLNGGTLQGMVKLTAGGVARNIADALGKLMPDSPPTFISAIGNDSMGHLLWKSIQHVDSNCVIKSGSQNSSFLLVLLDQQRDCAVSIGDMSINGCITPEKVMKNEEVFGNCSLIVLDANLSEDTISCILTLAQEKHIPVWLEPTDPCIATKPFHVTRSPDQIHYCSPNLQELQKIVSYLNGTPISNISANKNNVNEVITEARDLSLRLLPLIPNMMVTLSRHGILMMTLKQDKPKATYYKAIELNSIENVSGVGDCLASGYIAAMLNGCEESDCVRVGLNAAVQSLLSLQTVPDGLRYGVIEKPVSSIEIPLTGEVKVG